MIKIVAKTISEKSITYECPTCRTKYKKNGEPTARSKPVIHYHGNDIGTLENRETSRSHHAVWNYPKNKSNYNSVCIIINDSTLRV